MTKDAEISETDTDARQQFVECSIQVIEERERQALRSALPASEYDIDSRRGGEHPIQARHILRPILPIRVHDHDGQRRVVFIQHTQADRNRALVSQIAT